MSIIIALAVALVAAVISAATYPRPVAYPAAGVAAAALTIIAALLVRDAEYFAAVAVLALAVVVTGWAIAEALSYADRLRDGAEGLTPPVRRFRPGMTGYTITLEALNPEEVGVVERLDGRFLRVVQQVPSVDYGFNRRAAMEVARQLGAVFVAPGRVEVDAVESLAGGAL